MDQIVSVHQLVGDALVFEPEESDEPEVTENETE
jgi:hypothetical protein